MNIRIWAVILPVAVVAIVLALVLPGLLTKPKKSLPDEEETQQEENRTYFPYMPLEQGLQWEYERISNDKGQKESYIIRLAGGSKKSGFRPVHIKCGKVINIGTVMLYESGDFFCFRNMWGLSELQFLPFYKGETSWRWDTTDFSIGFCTCEARLANIPAVIVPAGKFEGCVKVEIEIAHGKEDLRQISLTFAKGTGLIEVTMGEVQLVLRKFSITENLLYTDSDLPLTLALTDASIGGAVRLKGRYSRSAVCPLTGAEVQTERFPYTLSTPAGSVAFNGPLPGPLPPGVHLSLTGEVLTATTKTGKFFCIDTEQIVVTGR